MQNTIVWLEDDPEDDWVRDRLREVEKLGHSVIVARGFRELDRQLRNLAGQPSSPSGPSEQPVLIILDVMIDGVENLTPYFPWLSDARTAGGYAAGLVFLDRVLSPPTRSDRDVVFGKFDLTPVIIYSNRVFSAKELQRIKNIAARRRGAIETLVKARPGDLSECVQRLLLPAKRSSA